MSQKPIIIGGNHHNTLGVIRALGYKGIHSVVLVVSDENDPYIAHSRYISQCVFLKSKSEIVPYLLEYARESNEKIVIFSCADFVTSELDKYFDVLTPYYYLPTSKEQGVCNHYMDKDVMASLAKRVGISIPNSWIVEDGCKIELQEVSFPCIVKPLASIHGSKSEIKIFHDRNLLREFLNAHNGHRFIVQEYINKDFEYQLIGCSLRNGNEIIIPGYSKCIRPCFGTNTGFLEYKSFKGFQCNLNACCDFIKTIGYQGLFSLEFIRDQNGNDYFLEINMRNDGNAICVTGSGVNLPYVWYQYCVGGDYSQELHNEISDIFVMPEFDDFMLVLKRKVSFTTWLKDYKRTTTFMEYCKHDPKPYYAQKKKLIKHLLYYYWINKLSLFLKGKKQTSLR